MKSRSRICRAAIDRAIKGSLCATFARLVAWHRTHTGPLKFTHFRHFLDSGIRHENLALLDFAL